MLKHSAKPSVIALLIVALACAACGSLDSEPAEIESGECFSNLAFSLAPTEDLARAAATAHDELGSPIHLPSLLPDSIDETYTLAGVIMSNREDTKPAFAAQIGQTESGSAGVLLFYSATPRCSVDEEEWNEETWDGRQVQWADQGDWPDSQVEATIAALNSGDLNVEVTMLWRSEHAPTEDERLEALRAIVRGFPP